MNGNDEAKLRSEAARGQRAAELMSDELLSEAFSTLRDGFTKAWQNSPARDTEGREKIWLMLNCLSGVEGHLSTVMTTGKMAALQLEQERTRLQRAKEWIKEAL